MGNLRDYLLEKELSFSKESMQGTIDDIVKLNDTSTLLKWLGLAGGKEKLLSLLKKLASNFDVELTKKFLKLLDQASKEWRAVPRNKYVKVYG